MSGADLDAKVAAALKRRRAQERRERIRQSVNRSKREWWRVQREAAANPWKWTRVEQPDGDPHWVSGKFIVTKNDFGAGTWAMAETAPLERNRGLSHFVYCDAAGNDVWRSILRNYGPYDTPEAAMADAKLVAAGWYDDERVATERAAAGGEPATTLVH